MFLTMLAALACYEILRLLVVTLYVRGQWRRLENHISSLFGEVFSKKADVNVRDG